MTSTAQLTGSHLRTYRTIFQHPISHNLGWHDVHALFRHIGQVEEEPNGNLKVTRNGQLLVLHPSRGKDVDTTEEVMALRHFLERSEATPPAASAADHHWLVVIDHQGARIFRSEVKDSLPEKILPHDPDEYFRHAHNSKDFSRGQEKPDPNSFFEPVAKALQSGGPILLFGTGTGTSSEMEQFVAWLKKHRADIAARIIGSLTVDEHHLTEGQLLAAARVYYAGRQVAHA